jgi:hypothetical protein
MWGLDHAVKPLLEDISFFEGFSPIPIFNLSSNFSESDFRAVEQAGCSGALRVGTLLLLLEAQGATTKLSVLHIATRYSGSV